MTNRLMMILAGLTLATAASAHPREHRGPPPPPMGPPCEGEISDAQRAQLRDEHLKFSDERIDLEAKEKHARVELMKALNAKSSDAAIRKAAAAAAEAGAKVRVAEELNRTEVMLKVFKPEQREKVAHCLMGPGPRPPHLVGEQDDGPAPAPVAAVE